MMRVGRTDEIVDGKVKQSFQFAKARRKAVGVHLRVYSLFCRRLSDLGTVFVGACIEKNLCAEQAMISCKRIGTNDLHRKTDMWISIHIRKRRRDIDVIRFHSVTSYQLHTSLHISFFPLRHH
jgi:hypothetical protein